MGYYLMDLERTIGSGVAHYWKGNQHGYTTTIKEAGVFSDQEANIAVKEDFDQRTVKISEKIVKRIQEGR